jgi:SNW domain-containing protein 1
VQFEKDTADPFNVDQFLSEVATGVGNKRYGVQEPEPRASKRARVEEDDDDDR